MTHFALEAIDYKHLTIRPRAVPATRETAPSSLPGGCSSGQHSRGSDPCLTRWFTCLG